MALEPVSCPVDAGGGYAVDSGGDATLEVLTIGGCGGLGSCGGAEWRVTATWLVAAVTEDWMTAGLGARGARRIEEWNVNGCGRCEERHCWACCWAHVFEGLRGCRWLV